MAFKTYALPQPFTLFLSPFGKTSLISARRRERSAMMPEIRSLGATI